jgi:hypothetical protein
VQGIPVVGKEKDQSGQQETSTKTEKQYSQELLPGLLTTIYEIMKCSLDGRDRQITMPADNMNVFPVRLGHQLLF